MLDGAIVHGKSRTNHVHVYKFVDLCGSTRLPALEWVFLENIT